jgi:hypothetical protein
MRTCTGEWMEREELIATICEIQAMNVLSVLQWERNGWYDTVPQTFDEEIQALECTTKKKESFLLM